MSAPTRMLLDRARAECARHAELLRYALDNLEPLRPIGAAELDALPLESIRDLDQFALRFTKLQDAMGAHLFPAILRAAQEPLEEATFLDKLNRLESLGVLDDANQWQTLRETRNLLAHEYPDEPQLRATVINRAMEQAERLLEILAGGERFITARLP